MRIGIVLSKTPAYSETFFISKIKGLQEFGALVTLFVQKKDADFNLCEVKVAPRIHKNPFLFIFQILSVGISLLPYISIVLKLFKLEKESGKSTTQILKTVFLNAHLIKANLDWLHFGFATIAIGSENVAKAINAKMALSVRGYDMDIYPLKFNNVYSLVWENVYKVHAISNYMLQKAIDNGMKNETAYEIIYPAVSQNFKVEKTINSYDDKTNTIQLFTIARLHWIKGLHDTLEALTHIKNQGITFHYNIVGDGPEYESLKFAVHQLGIEDDVFFLGKKSHKQTLVLLKNTDIYIQYSLSEGFCNAVLEAQSIGCLCVVSNGGGLSENILDKETGWVVPKRKPKDLANKLIEIINLTPEEKLKISRQAQERVKTTFALEQQKIKFQKFYKD